MAREFNTGDKRGELSAGTPGSMGMRTVISRAMTKSENGARRSIMLADVKTAFMYGDARRSLHVELALEGPLAAAGRYAWLELATLQWFGRTISGRQIDIKLKEFVTHPVVFQYETRDIFFLCACGRFAVHRTK